ncbi:uncharacterized protein [Ptychodera flava]|uniref:uncharacterized protein n=1 Tax=Ptychodera flava TaxID=63121 RepID=UPI00396A74E7
MERAVVRVFSLASVTPVDTTITSSAYSPVNANTVKVTLIVVFVAVIVVTIQGPYIKQLIGGNVINAKTERDPNAAGKHLDPKNNQNQSGLDPFWQFMCKIAQRIGDDSFRDMKILCTTSSGKSMLTKQQCENISRPLNLFEALKEAGHFEESNRSTVVKLLETVNLNSLADEVNNWS